MATRGAADRVARAMREHDVWVAVPTERLDDRECVLVHLDGTSLPDNVYEECDVMTLSDQLGEAIEQRGLGNTMATSTVPPRPHSSCTAQMLSGCIAASSRFCVHIPFVRTPVSSFGGPGAPERELRLSRV